MCADHTTRHGLDVVFFDFGGVIAEEGSSTACMRWKTVSE